MAHAIFTSILFRKTGDGKKKKNQTNQNNKSLFGFKKHIYFNNHNLEWTNIGHSSRNIHKMCFEYPFTFNILGKGYLD